MELDHARAVSRYQQVSRSGLPSHTHGLIQLRDRRPHTISRDVSNLEIRKPVTKILRSGSFREKLENVFRAVARGELPPGVQKLQKNVSHASDIEKAINQQGQPSPQHGIVPFNHIIQVNDLIGVKYRDKYSIAESQARCKLASLYRVIERRGWTLGIYNHISLRAPGAEDHFLINAFGLHYSEVTASNLVKVDLHGNVIDPGSTHFGISKAGYVIHSAIHEARKDIKCIIHLHTPHGAGTSAMLCGLLPLCQEALIVGGVSYHAYRGIACDVAERVEIVRDLGSVNKVMMLQNHGLLAMGSTVEEAYFICYNLMAACETQVMALSAGLANVMLVNNDIASKVFATVSGGAGGGVSRHRRLKPGELEYEALMRELDNLGYNTGYPYKLTDLMYPTSETDWTDDPSSPTHSPNTADGDNPLLPHEDDRRSASSPSAVSVIGKRITQEINRIKRERSKGVNMSKQLEKEQESHNIKDPIYEHGSIDLEQIASQSTGTCRPVYNANLSTGMGIGTGMGLNTGMEMGPHPGMGTGMGPHTGMGMGTGIGLNTGMSMGPNTGMRTGIGPHTGMGTGMGPHTGMGMGTGMGINTGMGSHTSMGPGIKMGTGLGPNTGMGMGTGMVPNTGINMGTGTGPNSGLGAGLNLNSEAGVGMGLKTRDTKMGKAGHTDNKSHDTQSPNNPSTGIRFSGVDQYIEEEHQPINSGNTPTSSSATPTNDGGMWDFLDERQSHGPLPLVTTPTITSRNQHMNAKKENTLRNRTSNDEDGSKGYSSEQHREHEVPIHPVLPQQTHQLLPDSHSYGSSSGDGPISSDGTVLPTHGMPGGVQYSWGHGVDKEYQYVKEQGESNRRQEGSRSASVKGQHSSNTIGQLHLHAIGDQPKQGDHYLMDLSPDDTHKELHRHGNEEPHPYGNKGTEEFHRPHSNEIFQQRPHIGNGGTAGKDSQAVTSNPSSEFHSNVPPDTTASNPSIHYDRRDIMMKVEATAKAVASSTDESVKKLSSLKHQQRRGETGHLLGNYPDSRTSHQLVHAVPVPNQLVQDPSVPVHTGSGDEATAVIQSHSVPVPTCTDSTNTDHQLVQPVPANTHELVQDSTSSVPVPPSTPLSSQSIDHHDQLVQSTSVPAHVIPPSTPPSTGSVTVTTDSSPGSMYLYSPPLLDSKLTGLNKALSTAKSVAKSTELSVEKLNKTNE